jgi:hypothetical protein
MSYTPVIPLGGLAGWRFLQKTMPRQTEAHDRQASIRRDEAYFRDRIGSVQTARELVADRRLLAVALGAFGLQSDINNRFFIRKVLEDGSLDPKALANRLADKNYLRLTQAFGFGDGVFPATGRPGFADQILSRWKERSFEVAVGTQNEAMRLALNARREIAALAAGNLTETAKWFSVMGSAPLRRVVETALGLPAQFASIDIDQQRAVLEERARAQFGAPTVTQFADPARLETLIQRFLLRDGAAAAGPSTSGASVALRLLGG